MLYDTKQPELSGYPNSELRIFAASRPSPDVYVAFHPHTWVGWRTNTRLRSKRCRIAKLVGGAAAKFYICIYILVIGHA